MREQRAEFMQPRHNHNGDAVMSGCLCHHVGANCCHDATVGQHDVSPYQHLHNCSSKCDCKGVNVTGAQYAFRIALSATGAQLMSQQAARML